VKRDRRVKTGGERETGRDKECERETGVRERERERQGEREKGERETG